MVILFNKKAIVFLLIFFVFCANKKDKTRDKEVSQVSNQKYGHSNKSIPLEENIQTLDLHYVQWACECANWATATDIERCQDTGKLSRYTIFVEPANSTLTLPDTIGYSGDVVKFTGQFYKDKTYYEGYVKGEQEVDKARVFRYTGYKVLNSNHEEVIKELKEYKKNKNISN